MLRVADLRKGVHQGILSFGFECNVEIDPGAGGWVAQTLSVGRNILPAVLDQHVISRVGRHEVGDGHGSEKGER